MHKIHEVAVDGALMPRFDDGMANMAEPVRVMAESLVNETMGAQADEAREGCRRRIHQKGEARGGGHGHRPHECQLGVEDMLVAGRVGRRPAGTR